MSSSGPDHPPQEVDFLLENLYIFAPNPHSKYKLRLVVREHSQEERLAKDQRRCDFRFVLQDALKEDQSQAEIYLFEQEKKAEKKEEYRVVGVGKLDLASCRQREHFSAENRLINGLIYGTKDVKGQKIIGKFSYRMFKVDRKEETNEFLSPQPITISRRRQKFPALTFRQSIVDKNAEINSKLNDLTRDIDETFKRDKHSSEKMQELNETIVQTLRDFVPQCKEYSYEYSEKMHSLMQNSPERSELYKISIRNIKICNNDVRKIQKLTSIGYLSPEEKDKQSQAIHHILIIFSEVFEQMQFRRKLIDLTFPVVYNINNNLKPDISFYLPKTSNRILLQIRTIKQPPSEVLVGYLKFGDNFNQIIEVFDKENQEKGFMIAIIDQQTAVSDQYLRQYHLQLQHHNRIVSPYNTKDPSKRRHSVANSRKLEQAADSRVNKLQASQQPSGYLPSKKSHKFRKVKNPQFFVNKTQQSDICMPGSRARAPQQSSMNKKFRVKQYSIPSSASNQQELSRVRLLNFSNSKRSFKFYQKLYLESISVNLDTSCLTNVRKVLLHLQLNEQIHMKKAHVSNGVDINWTGINLSFQTTIHEHSRLRIGCYMKERQVDDSDYRELGRCIISLQQMRNASGSLYSIILANSNRIAGKVQLKFNINQSRVLSQIDQYNEQSSRLISKKKQEYQLSLNSSIVSPFGRKISKASSVADKSGRSASKKSEINKQIG